MTTNKDPYDTQVFDNGSEISIIDYTDEIEVSLYLTTGQLMMRENNSSIVTLSKRDYSPGVYILVIRNSSGIITQKIQL